MDQSLISRKRMTGSARKPTESACRLRDIYSIIPNAPLVHREFGYFCLERWYEQGLDREANLNEVFHYNESGSHGLHSLGWCEAAFAPAFEDKVVEVQGTSAGRLDRYEIVQDYAGRKLRVFKGRRNGFMPEYVDHPVKDMKSWQEKCQWRLDPKTPERWTDFDKTVQAVKESEAKGLMVSQGIIGGYMYLRSLIGPTELMYAFYDMPEVVHDCMQTWLKLADAVTTRHQQHVTFDEVFFGEDICYNHGPLCSPEIMKEFLFPYYQEMLNRIKDRQIDKTRHLYVHIDSDGWAVPVIPLYQKAIGMDVMSPFEVASGCDVVKIGRQFSGLVMFGGIDKRVLAQDKAAIDRHVEYIIPAMRQRGGYIPTCDHGVPEEVTLENYLHYRKRCVELGG